MDAVDLQRKLARLAEDNLQRAAREPRDDLLRRALGLEDMARRMGNAACVAAAMRSRADVLLTLNRNVDAVGVLAQAGCELTASRRSDDTERGDQLVTVLASLAEAQGRLGRWSDLYSTCAAGIPIVEHLRSGISPLYVQSAYLRFGIGLYAWGARAACELGRIDQMLEWAELSKSRATLRYQQPAPAGDSRIGGSEHDFRQLDGRINRLRASGQEVPAELVVHRRQLWDAMYTQRFQRHDGELTATLFRIKAIQALLDPDEAVLYYYWLDRTRLVLVAIDRQQVTPHVRMLSEPTRTMLERLSATVLHPATRRSPDDVEPDDELSELLLPEAFAAVLEGKERLTVSPHRVLHTVPFHALQWRGRYVVERFAVTYVPNLTSLLHTWQPSLNRGLLAVGISEYDLAREYVNPLPNAQPEAENVAAMYAARGIPTTTLLGRQATTGELERMAADDALREFSSLHLATHGNDVDAETPMEANLILRDGRIDGLAISSWRLDADLVVLSACSSGQRPVAGRGLDELPGDELFGLQAALFAAGTHQLVGALWPVSDRVAPAVMTAFHHHYLTDPRADVALQRAIVEHLESANILSRKPYYWAPFFLAAMGRPSRIRKGV